MTVLLILLILALALCGAPIFSCMVAISIVGLTAHAGGGFIDATTGSLVDVLALATSSQALTLSTIPLFVFAGYIMAEAGTARRLVGFAQALVGWFPGGLALVTIGACAIFTTFTGASGVTIVAIGGLLLPALLKEGYPEKFSLGLVTGTGAIGLLFPPALPLIVYGVVYGMNAQAGAASQGDTMTLVDFSVERFLFAGIVPGLFLCGMVGLYAFYIALKQKVPRTKFEPLIAARTFIKALPELAIPVLIIVSLATGKLIIPEAAALTALYVFVIEVFLYRDVKLGALPRIARESLMLVGAIYIVIVAATMLTSYFVDAGLPETIYHFLDKHIESKWTFLLCLNVLLLIVGCLMDIFSAIVVVVPLIVPAAMHYNVDPYHLGVIFLLNLEIGYLTPPVGLNLFITSFRFNKPMVVVVRAAMPFLLVMLASLLVITYVPALTPVKAKGKPAATVDAPATVGGTSIVLPDGRSLSPADCETETIKLDPIAHAECMAKFTAWERCESLGELEKLECRDAVIESATAPPTDAAPGAPVDDDDWDMDEEPAADQADAAVSDTAKQEAADDDWELE